MSIINHTSHVYSQNVESSVLRRLLCMALLLGLPFFLSGATHVVTSADESPAPGLGTLRHEIENATSGDTILIDPSITEIIMDHFVGITIESKNLTIIGHDDFTIRCTQSFYIFRILSSSVKIIDVVFKDAKNFGAIIGLYSNIEVHNCELLNNHSDQYGGAIYINGGNLTINNSIISGNTGRSGGGILFQGDELNISNTEITNNEISNANGNGGGIFLSKGKLNLTNSEVTNNQATRTGGGIYSNSDCTISNSMVNNNTASSSGGGIYMYSGKLTLMNQSQINENTASIDGGGIYLNSTGDTEFEATNSAISHNQTIQYGGGGIHIRPNGHTKKITNCEFIGNTAKTEGGAIYNQGSLELNGVNMEDNNARFGAGLYVYSGTATIDQSHIQNNQAVIDGGGIYCRTNLIIRNQSTVNFNTAGQTGGGLWLTNYGGLTSTISSSTFQENQALRAAGILVDQGTLNIVAESTIHKNQNTGNYDGGGIFSEKAALNINHSDITENSSPTNGGGIFINQQAALTTNQATISKNSSSNGGGIYLKSTAHIQNSFISQNTANGPGGGIYVAELPGARLELIQSDIHNNSGSHGGGIMLYQNSNANTITNCEIKNNTASNQGGGLWMKANTTIAGSTFENNGSNDQGGAIFMDHGSSTIQNTDITSNTANKGGGIYLYNGTLNIPSSLITRNQSDMDGGGVYLHSLGSLKISANSEISENSASNHGGGIFCQSSVEIENSSVIKNSSAENGGGAYLDGGNMSVVNSSIDFNTASKDGGGIYVTDNGSANLSLDQAIFVGNEAGQSGGGVYTNKSLIIDQSIFRENFATTSNGGGLFAFHGDIQLLNNSIFKSNEAKRYGGGIYLNDGVHSIMNSSITHNQSGNSGGGIFFNEQSLSIHNSKINHNESTGNKGGGIHNEKGALTITSSEINNNSAFTWGGGVYSSYLAGAVSFNISQSQINGNSANNGGGISVDVINIYSIKDCDFIGNSATYHGGGINSVSGTGMLKIENTSIRDNTAESGGGIYNSSMNLSISNSEINHNSSSHNGGGIYHTANDLTIFDSDLMDNQSNYNGGGIWNGGTINVGQSKLKNNSARYWGGGIHNIGTANLSQAIVQGNHAKDGGGIATIGNIDIASSTVTNNTADQGGGLKNESYQNYPGNASIINTIISLNTASSGPDIHNTSSITGDFNLLSDYQKSGLSPNGTNNLIGDPLFASNFSNLNLTPCSPAIDAASNGTDIGALQSGLTAIVPVILTTSITVALDQTNPDSVSITPGMIDFNFQNCSDISIDLFPTTFDCSHVGQTTQTTATVTYSGGQTFQESIEIIVLDALAPHFTQLPPEDTVFIQASDPLPDDYPVQYEDQCNGMVTLTINDESTTLSCGNAIKKTYTITDPSGNSMSYEQTIIIGDENGPQITILDNEVSDVGQRNLTPYYHVMDDTSYHSFTRDETIQKYCGSAQLIRRTYTAIDACQNTTVETKEIEFLDSKSPEIEGVASWMKGVKSGDTIHLVDCVLPPAQNSDISWNDNSGNATVYSHIYKVDLPVDAPFGMHRIANYHYRVDDGCSNISELDFHVALYDLAGPQFQRFPMDTTISSPRQLPPVDLNVYALDVCTYVVWDTVITFPVIDPITGDTTAFSRKWIARDLVGHEAFQEQIINIRNSSLGQISGHITFAHDTIPHRFPGEIGENGISFTLHRLDTARMVQYTVDSTVSQNWFGSMGSYYFTALPPGQYKLEVDLPDGYTAVHSDSLFDQAGWSDTLDMQGGSIHDLGLLVMHPGSIDSWDTTTVDSIPADSIFRESSRSDKIVSRKNQETMERLEWKVFPNPSNGFIQFNLPILPGNEKFKFNVYNNSGKIVRKGSLVHGDVLYLGSIPDGMYVVQVYLESEFVDYRKLLLVR